VVEQATLDSLLFVPAAIPPHKRDHEPVAGKHRLQMLLRSVQGNPRLKASDIELQRGGVSYTVDTLRQLGASMPDHAFSFVMGMDMLADFPNWRSRDEILDLAEILVLTRPDFPLPKLEHKLRERVRICRIPDVGVSSSEIRRRVKEGKSIRYMVIEDVEEYIVRHRLYLR
jgi:nicotinate-nucleotide adenylyltransferase